MKKPLLSEMTLREKIAQTLLVQQYYLTRKYEVDPSIWRTREERDEILRREQYGMLWFAPGYSKSIEQSERYSKKEMSAVYREFLMQENACLKIPALTCGDAEREGAGAFFEDLTTTCCPLTVGAADSEELSYEQGAAIARELRTAGVNWRWSPPVDMVSTRTAGVLRTFAPDNAERMIALANAHIKGMQDNGVAATAKHFPGSDRYEYRDSHFTDTKIFISMEEWWKEQGRVFQEIINAGVYSIMISHKAFPACDNTKIKGKYVPCTISKKVITDLLKGQMGFQGVVITDGIQMAALYSLLPYEELVVELINAGNDAILGALSGTTDILEKAVLEGKVAESRIDDACQRLLDMKEKLGLFEDNYQELDYTAADVTPKTREVNLEIARKGITLVRDRKQLLPLDKEKIKNVTIICSTHDDVFYEELRYMKAALEKRGSHVKMQRRLTNNEELESISAESDLILYAGFVAGHRPKGGSGLFGEEAKTFLYAFSSGKEKSIGVSMGYPYLHYDYMEGVDTFINTYDMSPEMMEVFVEAIFGEIPLIGKSPVNLVPDRRYW